jgi:nitrite reductase/ring-hydroxylating ferredoxin subunit
MSETPQRLSATPPGVILCRLADIKDGAARNFVLDMRAGRFFGFAVRRGQTVVGYVDRCPHMGLPLAQTLDHYLSDAGTHILCSWHGAVFDVADGSCKAGPCNGAALTPWPLAVADGYILTAAPRS